MSVTGYTIAAMGAIFGVSGFLIGRHFASLTPKKAAEMEKRNGGRPVDLTGLHRIGKVQMVSAPVIAAILAWVGLSGMAG